LRRRGGEKRGKVGIQEEFQTDKEENWWILWQGPRVKRVLALVMPFHS
jgi:hypothetical protein